MNGLVESLFLELGLRLNEEERKSRITTAEEGFVFFSVHFMKRLTRFFPSRR
jgi:hypothetical protein